MSGRPAARFGFLYKMKVRTQSNNIGEWGQWNINPGGAATEEDMRMGHEFRKALEERRTIVDKSPDLEEGPRREGAEDPM